MIRQQKAPLWLFVTIAVVVMSGMSYGTYDFIHRWHTRGDIFVQAEGSLLTFIAACMSVLVTLAFIYLTRRSVEAAQQANEEQRKEWEQRVNVSPKFWIGRTASNDWFLPAPPGTNALTPIGPIDGFSCVVWNYSDQSVLIEDICAEPADELIPGQKFIELNCVLKPHSDQAIDITLTVMGLISDTKNLHQNRRVLKQVPNQSSRLKLSLQYTDWQHQSVRSEPRLFEINFDRSVYPPILVTKALE
jgi:hypothetical protein